MIKFEVCILDINTHIGQLFSAFENSMYSISPNPLSGALRFNRRISTKIFCFEGSFMN